MNKRAEICFNLTAAEFEEQVLQGNGTPAFILFGADWSGTTLMLNSALSEIASDYLSKVNFYQIDVENEEYLAQMMDIREVPTVFIFKNGEVIDKFVGLTSKSRIRSKLESATLKY